MKTIEYRTIDKSEWTRGPWDNEPDKRQWLDAETGLPCILRRHPSCGHLCGYVGVPAGHPLHGKTCDDAGLDAHGGVNHASGCSHGEASTSICHVVGEGEMDNVWWFGFDCGHAWDISPGLEAKLPEHLQFTRDSDCEYRTVEYVEMECHHLAKQIAAMA